MKNLLTTIVVLLFSFSIAAHATSAELSSAPKQSKSLQKHASNQAKKRINGVYCGDTTA